MIDLNKRCGWNVGDEVFNNDAPHETYKIIEITPQGFVLVDINGEGVAIPWAYYTKVN